MEALGKLTGASRSFDGKKLLVTFEVETDPEQIEEIRSYDLLKIIANKFSKKRSLDANGYCWALCTKIARHPDVNSTKDEVYEDMIQKYGFVYEDEEGYLPITIKCGIDIGKIGGHWKFIKSNGKFASYLRLKGSSEYSVQEMQQFLSNIVDEAKGLGIDTATPQEIERMMDLWQRASYK